MTRASGEKGILHWKSISNKSKEMKLKLFVDNNVFIALSGWKLLENANWGIYTQWYWDLHHVQRKYETKNMWDIIVHLPT